MPTWWLISLQVDRLLYWVQKFGCCRQGCPQQGLPSLGLPIEDKIDGGWANSERLKAIALDLGLDSDLFEGCLDSGKYSKRVQYNTQQARDHNVRGTPNFIVVGPDGQQQLGGAQPFSVFKQVLDKMI